MKKRKARAGTAEAAGQERLVIDHTGREIRRGRTSSCNPRRQRSSGTHVLTRLADEKAYRRLAISQTPIGPTSRSVDAGPAGPASSGSVDRPSACLEQLQRLGVGMAPSSAAAASLPPAPLARPKRGNLTDADLAAGRAVRAQSRNWPRAWRTSRPARVAPTWPKAGTTSPRAATIRRKGGDDSAGPASDVGQRSASHRRQRHARRNGADVIAFARHPTGAGTRARSPHRAVATLALVAGRRLWRSGSGGMSNEKREPSTIA